MTARALWAGGSEIQMLLTPLWLDTQAMRPAAGAATRLVGNGVAISVSIESGPGFGTWAPRISVTAAVRSAATDAVRIVERIETPLEASIVTAAGWNARSGRLGQTPEDWKAS